ncbi:MAG: hypothetical protein JNJ69_06860 [Leptospiraceae bacterium]|nr:hypothetical protein [Leptospiraceae bacterium]
MKHALACILIVALCGPAHARDVHETATATYLAQNIFDDDAADTPAEKPAVEKPAKKSADDGEKSKPAAKAGKKKRRGKKKKKSAASTEAPRSGYSTAEVARASYEWAPETEPVKLMSSAPGIKSSAEAPAIKPATAAVKSEPIETKPQPQGFKLPQIPLAQVLIVAGFVLLFLIYRFRVGKQIKRKKY